MKLLWERLRRIAPGAAGYGACMGLCLFWLVQYARLSGLYSLLSALRAAVPSLPFVLIGLLYLFILLRCALLGVHSLDFSAPGDAVSTKTKRAVRESILYGTGLSCISYEKIIT